MKYLQTPTGVGGHFVVGVWVFMETHRRVFGGKFGAIPKPLREDAFAQGGYCIDAPNEMPAGACYYDEFGPPDEDGPQWLVSQRLVMREATT